MYYLLKIQYITALSKIFCAFFTYSIQYILVVIAIYIVEVELRACYASEFCQYWKFERWWEIGRDASLHIVASVLKKVSKKKFSPSNINSPSKSLEFELIINKEVVDLWNSFLMNFKSSRTKVKSKRYKFFNKPYHSLHLFQNQIQIQSQVLPWCVFPYHKSQEDQKLVVLCRTLWAWDYVE